MWKAFSSTGQSCYGKIALLFVLILLVPLFADAAGAQPKAPAAISLAVFRSPSCSHCADVEKGALARLGKRLGVELDVRYYNIDTIENYKLLLSVEKELNDDENDFPVVVIGEAILGGAEEIKKHLERNIIDLAAEGGEVAAVEDSGRAKAPGEAEETRLRERPGSLKTLALAVSMGVVVVLGVIVLRGRRRRR